MWNLRGDVNLRVDPDTRLCASELSPSEHGHAQVDGGGDDAVELSLWEELAYLCKNELAYKAYLLRFRIGCKDSHFKTRAVY